MTTNGNIQWGIADDPSLFSSWLLEPMDQEKLSADHPLAPEGTPTVIRNKESGLYIVFVSGGVHGSDTKEKATVFYHFEKEYTLKKLKQLRSIGGGINNGLRKLFGESNQQDHPPATVTEEDLAYYNEHGYVVCRNIIPPEIMQKAKTKIQQGLDANNDRKKVFGKELQRWGKEYQNSSEVLNLFNHSPAFKNCEVLTGMRIKPPSESQIALRKQKSDGKKDFFFDTIDWHVDAPWGKASACWFNSVVLVALSDWEEDNMGNFTAYPGSQVKILEMINQQSALEFRRTMEQKTDLQIPPKQIHARAGDVVFTHPLLAHDIAPNTSDKVRWAVLFRPVPYQQLAERKNMLSPSST